MALEPFCVRCHSFFVVRTVFEPFWLSVCRHSFLVWRNIHGLLTFLFRSHSFLVMQKACAFFRLGSRLLSFDRDISHEREMVQLNLCYRRRYSKPTEVKFCFNIWLFRPCVGDSSNWINGVQRIASLKNLTPFCKGFPCEEKECGSPFWSLQK